MGIIENAKHYIKKTSQYAKYPLVYKLFFFL